MSLPGIWVGEGSLVLIQYSEGSIQKQKEKSTICDFTNMSVLIFLVRFCAWRGR